MSGKASIYSSLLLIIPKLLMDKIVNYGWYRASINGKLWQLMIPLCSWMSNPVMASSCAMVYLKVCRNKMVTQVFIWTNGDYIDYLEMCTIFCQVSKIGQGWNSYWVISNSWIHAHLRTFQETSVCYKAEFGKFFKP